MCFGDFVHRVFVDLRLRYTGALWNFQRVVTAFDFVECGGEFEAFNQRADFVGSSECVAGALDEKHWRFDVFQVGVPEFVGMGEKGTRDESFESFAPGRTAYDRTSLLLPHGCKQRAVDRTIDR